MKSAAAFALMAVLAAIWKSLSLRLPLPFHRPLPFVTLLILTLRPNTATRRGFRRLTFPPIQCHPNPQLPTPNPQSPTPNPTAPARLPPEQKDSNLFIFRVAAPLPPKRQHRANHPHPPPRPPGPPRPPRPRPAAPRISPLKAAVGTLHRLARKAASKEGAPTPTDAGRTGPGMAPQAMPKLSWSPCLAPAETLLWQTSH